MRLVVFTYFLYHWIPRPSLFLTLSLAGPRTFSSSAVITLSVSCHHALGSLISELIFSRSFVFVSARTWALCIRHHRIFLSGFTGICQLVYIFRSIARTLCCGAQSSPRNTLTLRTSFWKNVFALRHSLATTKSITASFSASRSPKLWPP